jgi:tRNA (guanosine-2'-O-)-methyltransferase
MAEMIGANAGRQTLVVNQSADSLAEAVRCDLGSSQSTHAFVVLGDERYGIPSEAMEILDLAIEIPMIGTGDSLNVAVAGSLLGVLYKLAGRL